jgi:hypothetical protein
VDRAFDLDDRLGKTLRRLGPRLEYVIRDALRRLGADAGQPFEFLEQPLD